MLDKSIKSGQNVAKLKKLKNCQILAKSKKLSHLKLSRKAILNKSKNLINSTVAINTDNTGYLTPKVREAFI